VLQSDSSQVSAITGLQDIFHFADTLVPQMRISVDVVHCMQTKTLPPADCIVFPPCIDAGAAVSGTSPEIQNWVLQQHTQGARLYTICAGALLLASLWPQGAGLPRRTISVHAGLIDHLQRISPMFVPADVGAPLPYMYDDGDIVSFQGFFNWIDAGLYMLFQHVGIDVLPRIARHFGADIQALLDVGHTRMVIQPKATAGQVLDVLVVAAQHWIHAHKHEKMDVQALCMDLGTTQRTLTRRFQRDVGLAPKAYMQYVRVRKAQDYLRRSQHNVEEIAWHLGYEDASAFRRIFKRYTGVSPQNFRDQQGNADQAVR
jgi:transcriptional regulator GlxA family with amidase domain